MDKDEILEQSIPNEITRIDIINHAKNHYEYGVVLTLDKRYDTLNSVELSFQDGGKTLKIFIT